MTLMLWSYLSISSSSFMGTSLITNLSFFAHFGSSIREKYPQITGSSELGGLILRLSLQLSFFNSLGGLWDTEPLTDSFYHWSIHLSSYTWTIKDNKWRPLPGASSKQGNRLDHCHILRQVACGRIILHSLLSMFNNITIYFGK